ncbi:MAG: BMP family ABC transporter substrate-binding protein [Elusimicrobiota bacterium]
MMKNRIYIMMFLVLFQVGCSTQKRDESIEKYRVGLVFDIGGRGDKSFNDAAYLGLNRAEQELGVYTEYIELASGVDRESALRVFAAKGFDVIFGIGFMFTDDITRLAREYPQLQFACVDYTIGAETSIPNNLAALRFREEEGAFLVGAIAGLTTKRGAIGFIGGMDIPLINKFEAGYRMGAKMVFPECRVIVSYAGGTSEAFKNPSRGKELARSQYVNGADIIFHAAGSTGLGVFEAARDMDKLAIGVDSDQFHEAPGHVLTSMIKRVDNAVYKTIKDAMAGAFFSGVQSFGLAENGIGYVYDDNNRELIPEHIIEKVEKLKEKIINGQIEIPVE